MTAIWATVAFVGFGLALIAWDQLTDFFASTRPGEEFDEDEDEGGLGAEIDGTVTAADHGDVE